MKIEIWKRMEKADISCNWKSIEGKLYLKTWRVVWGEIDFSLNLFFTHFPWIFLICVWWNVAKSNDKAQVQVGDGETQEFFISKPIFQLHRGKFVSRDSNFSFYCAIACFIWSFINFAMINFSAFIWIIRIKEKVFMSETCVQNWITGFASCLLQHCCVIISSLCFSIQAMFITSKKVSSLFSKNYHHYRKKVFFFDIDFKLGRRFKRGKSHFPFWNFLER